MAQALSGRRLWFNSCILLSDRVISMCQLLPISKLYRGLTTANKNTYSNTCNSTTNSKVLNAFAYDGNDDSPKELNKNQFTNIQISPNPNTGKFTLLFENKMENTIFISIVDLSGKVIWSDLLKVENEQISLDLNPIRNGIYIISVSDNTINYKAKLVITKNE